LFYLALLALGEVMRSGSAYMVAATASSLLIVRHLLRWSHPREIRDCQF